MGDRARTERSEPAPGGALFRIDAGWLFLVAGAALLVATVLIPAADDLAEARWHRDRALAVEKYRAKRLESYSEFLDAIARQDRSLVVSLAASQLNMAPADRLPMLDTTEVGTRSASVFPSLEPAFEPAPTPKRPDSTLQRWATDNRRRLWLIISGGMCVLVGLMPPARAATAQLAGKGGRRS